MKTKLLFVTLMVVFLAACGSTPAGDGSTSDLDLPDPASEGVQAEDEIQSQAADPSEDEIEEGISESLDGDPAGIAFMREEEKLARDVYLQLAELWNMNIFGNIASSEETHMGAVLSLIDMADLEDPAEGLGQGEFLNEELQNLYDQLVARGGQSLAEALLVGAAIEEIDILDLQKFLAETDDPAIIEVYQNLLKGSINHLNSFVRTYERQTGEEYQPQYLSEEAYQALVSTGNSSGQRGGNGSSQGQGKYN